MGSVNWGDAATWAGVVISAAIAGVALWQAIRSKSEARESREHARRSADAAERSARAAERQAALAEAEAKAVKEEPPWRLDQLGSVKFHLVNDGPATAHDVSIESDLIMQGPAQAERIGRNEALVFFASAGLDVIDRTITVYWSWEPGGERLEWRYPLP